MTESIVLPLILNIYFNTLIVFNYMFRTFVSSIKELFYTFINM